MERTQPPAYIRAVSARPRLVRALLVLNMLAVVFTVAAFSLGGVILAFKSTAELVLYLVFAAVPFLAVTLMRRIFDLPRPYEVFDFPVPKAGAKCGRSFPSRHVTSAFLIATLLSGVYLPLAIPVFVAALITSAVRVLLGIHFVRDVLAGAAVGIFGGILPMILQIFVN